jgi:hypothetical protein
MWDVDGIPTGPGLVKRHGVLDTNWDSPNSPLGGGPSGKRQIPAWTAADAGKVLMVQADGSLAWVALSITGSYNASVAYENASYIYDEG